MAAGPLFSKPISGNNRHSWSIALTATHSIYPSSPVEIQCAQIRSTIAKRIEPIIINAVAWMDTLGGGEKEREKERESEREKEREKGAESIEAVNHLNGAVAASSFVSGGVPLLHL